MMELREATRYLRFFLIIFLVVGTGLFAVNQALQYQYRSEFLQKPCKVCVDLNPEVKDCMVIKQTLYPNGTGGWTNNTGAIYYNLSGLEKLIIP